MNHIRAELERKFGPGVEPDSISQPPPKQGYIAVCLPAQDFVHTTLLTDMMRLMHDIMTHCAGFHPIIVRDTILQRSRSMLVAQALKHKQTTHVLFIDTDMRFPPDVARRMMAHDKDIVGCNYRHRTVRVDSTARGMNDQWVNSAERSGLEEVLHTGTGMLLIKRRVFEKMEKPWFETTYRHMQDDWMGEDVFFCVMARRAGFKVWIDHDLSKEVGHVGLFEYGWTDGNHNV